MIPSGFEYLSATSIDEAVTALAEHGDDAKVMAGGHSLLPLMRLRLAVPSVLVDLNGVDELRYIHDRGDYLAVGAMTRYADLETSELIRGRAPLLAESISLVGDVQVRNRGTLGGAVAHADPAGDMPTIVLALGATIVARGKNGERTIRADDFFEDIFTSTLRSDEVLTEIRIPVQPNAVGNYQKFRRRAIDWAMVGAAVNLTRSNGRVDYARVVLTNVARTPVRARAVEEVLAGQTINSDLIARASEAAEQGLDPSGDVYASPEYKRHLAQVLTRRAIGTALAVS